MKEDSIVLETHENTKNIAVMSEKLINLKDEITQVNRKLDAIPQMIKEVSDKIDNKYATKDEVKSLKNDFGKMKSIAWSIAAAVLLYVLNLFLGLIDIK